MYRIKDFEFSASLKYPIQMEDIPGEVLYELDQLKELGLIMMEGTVPSGNGTRDNQQIVYLDWKETSKVLHFESELLDSLKEVLPYLVSVTDTDPTGFFDFQEVEAPGNVFRYYFQGTEVKYADVIITYKNPFTS